MEDSNTNTSNNADTTACAAMPAAESHDLAKQGFVHGSGVPGPVYPHRQSASAPPTAAASRNASCAPSAAPSRCASPRHERYEHHSAHFPQYMPQLEGPLSSEDNCVDVNDMMRGGRGVQRKLPMWDNIMREACWEQEGCEEADLAGHNRDAEEGATARLATDAPRPDAPAPRAGPAAGEADADVDFRQGWGWSMGESGLGQPNAANAPGLDMPGLASLHPSLIQAALSSVGGHAQAHDTRLLQHALQQLMHVQQRQSQGHAAQDLAGPAPGPHGGSVDGPVPAAGAAHDNIDFNRMFELGASLCCNLWVGNLRPQVSSLVLEAVLEEFGPVEHIVTFPGQR